MLTLCTPHLRLNSIVELNFDRLRSQGVEGLLLDLDGTLKDYRAEEFPAVTLEWLHQAGAAGMRLCLVSNGRRQRIEPLARQLSLPVVAMAGKPWPRGLRQALKQLGLPAGKAAIVGDQVFTDVLAGRLAGLRTILVEPCGPHEPWMTSVKRPLERWWLRRIEHRCPAPQPLGRPAEP
jgi:HAD superfamily phosphatase (TIGR01668 family)